MDEKKKSAAVEVKEDNGKLSYEQLERVARDLNMQCRQLASQLQSAQRVISEFNDLEMLLGILAKSEYFHESFVSRCVDTIENLVTKALDNAEKASQSVSDAKEEVS